MFILRALALDSSDSIKILIQSIPVEKETGFDVFYLSEKQYFKYGLLFRSGTITKTIEL